jgi:hypothetical protein
MSFFKGWWTVASREPFKTRIYSTLASVIVALATNLPSSHAQNKSTQVEATPPTTLAPPATNQAQKPSQTTPSTTVKKAPETPTPAVNNTVSQEPKANGGGDDGYSWMKLASFVLSVFALVVSACVALYTLRKDRRARLHSIEDDYWLRKVIGPIAIEPLLKTFLEMIGSSPEDCGSPGFSKAAVAAYHDAYVTKLSELAANVSALTLVSPDLAAQTSTSIDSIQELMIGYCYDNESQKKTGTRASNNRQAFQKVARDELVKMLQHIKSYQLTLK